MAVTGLLALLDDITTLLDDVSVLSKAAVKQTAGVLGDDLALNAEKVSGVKADRELPVVWAVAKGSFVNKLILVPLALAISAFIPWLIQPLLMLGGLYLCYEGAEKVWHLIKKDHQYKDKFRSHLQAAKTPQELLSLEKAKVRGAIRTDFVLSAEIIVIALGAVASQPLLTQSLVVSFIAIVVTMGVYFLVALIVRLDDIGVFLSRSKQIIYQSLGRSLLVSAPYLIRLLSVVGTIAMFLVGGGIFIHGLPALHHAVELITLQGMDHFPLVQAAANTLLSFITGLLIGLSALIIMTLFSYLRR